MLENIQGHSQGSIPPLRKPSLLPHDLCHEWNVSHRLPAHSEDFLFVLFKVPFTVQKLLSLLKSHLSNFAFISITVGGGSERILLWFLSKSILPMFSSKTFRVSDLIFKSLTHFELIFVYGVRKCSNFILLHVAVQFSQHHFLKRLFFLHCIFLPPLSNRRCP